MRRRLILMRHAKSSWKDPAQSDHERPLNQRGRREAPLVARQLVEMKWIPQRVLSSDAKRTKETFERFGPFLGDELEVAFLAALYHAGIMELRRALARLPDDVDCVLALGHNPGWEDALEWLTGRPAEMKTAYAALLTGQGETWSKAVEIRGAWKCKEILTPGGPG
jgi:phosphohistidine phosphatase